jgi:hypothetical protein
MGNEPWNYSVSEAAERLGFERHVIDTAIKSGNLRSFIPEGMKSKRYITREALADYQRMLNTEGEAS